MSLSILDDRTHDGGAIGFGTIEDNTNSREYAVTIPRKDGYRIDVSYIFISVGGVGNVTVRFYPWGRFKTTISSTAYVADAAAVLLDGTVDVQNQLNGATFAANDFFAIKLDSRDMIFSSNWAVGEIASVGATNSIINIATVNSTNGQGSGDDKAHETIGAATGNEAQLCLAEEVGKIIANNTTVSKNNVFSGRVGEPLSIGIKNAATGVASYISGTAQYVRA